MDDMGQYGQQAAQWGQEGIAQTGQLMNQAAGQMGNVAQMGGEVMQQAGQVAGQVGAQMGQVAGQAGQVAGQVAGSLGNMTGELTEMVGEVSGEVAEQLQEGQAQLGAAMAQAGALVGDALKEAPEFLEQASYQMREAGEVAVKTFEATGDFFKSEVFANIPAPDFTAVASTYNMGKEALTTALNAIRGIELEVFDFVKFDIFRDFSQFVGLMLGSIAALAEVVETMRMVFSIFALNIKAIVDQLVSSWTPIWTYYIMIALTMISLVWFRVKMNEDPDSIRDGNELVDWKDRAKGDRTTSRVLITILTTIYLPVSRNAVMMIYPCQPSVDKSYAQYFGDGCYAGEHYVHIGFAALVLAAVTIYVPILCHGIVTRNRPQPVLFDAEGKPKEYTDEDYKEDLDKDKCPYSFLYKGYERKWGSYKSIVMSVKFLLLIPIIMLISYPLIQAFGSFVILIIYAVISSVARPFIKDTDDFIDIGARVATTITSCFAILAVLEVNLGGANGTILTSVHLINAGYMIIFTIIGTACCQLKIKNMTGRVDFTHKKTWDLQRERKLRIWHPFWDALFLNDESLGHVHERLEKIKTIVGQVGFDRYYNALLPIPMALAQERYFLETTLEGLDVFWDGIPEDGELDDPTCFGKMYIKPFPFQCVMVYDIGDDYTFVPDHDVMEFAQKNRHPEILRRRGIRQQLRCLDGQQVYFFHQAIIMKSVEDRSRPREGGGYENKSVPVEFTFQHGNVSVKRNKKSEWSAGFGVSLTLFDGYGQYEGETFTNEHLTIGHGALGILDDYRPTEQLYRLLQYPQNAMIICQAYPQLLLHHQNYRNQLMFKRRSEEMTLSYGFWYWVYNNDRISYEELHYYLANFEMNPQLKAAFVNHAQGFQYVYFRLNQYNAHPCMAYWFCFWSDLWEENSKMDAIKDHGDLLDPAKPSFIGYKPVPQDELNGMLDADLNNLLATHLDELYATMAFWAANPCQL